MLEERARLGPLGVDWHSLLTAAREENQRVREEASMYKSIMQQRMERASVSGLSNQDSKTEEARLAQEVSQPRLVPLSFDNFKSEHHIS